jgi:autotransporter-associated beta strand protein
MKNQPSADLLKTNRAIAVAAVVALLAMASAPCVLADTTWISTSSSLWSTPANWNNGVPSTAPTGAVFNNTTGIQHVLDLAGTARVAVGIEFNSGANSGGFTFNSSANPGPGIFLRAGGTVNGILNNDTFTQNINVPVKLTSSTGIQGPGAAMVFNAANGNLVFNGTNQSSAAWSINLNGASNLTFAGSANITIGGATSSGSIVNTNTGNNGGLIKNGAGTLTLGGTGANTFIGGNVINQGIVVAAKNNALGSGNNLTLAGGTFQNNGGGQSLSQSIGTLTLSGNSAIDMGSGVSTVKFADSSGATWGSFTLDVLNWTAGDTLSFGTTSGGVTGAQLSDIVFGDLGNAPAQIDSIGNITPGVVPEPSTLAIGLLGGLGAVLCACLRRQRN